MIYLLDTNAIGASMREDLRMASWLSPIGADDRVVVCTISRGEILFGLERLAPGRRRTDIEPHAAVVLMPATRVLKTNAHCSACSLCATMKVRGVFS